MRDRVMYVYIFLWLSKRLWNDFMGWSPPS